MKEEKKQMGRPRFGTEKRHMVGIAMEPSLHERLRKEAEGTGVSISLTACEAIDEFLTKREETRAMFGM